MFGRSPLREGREAPAGLAKLDFGLTFEANQADVSVMMAKILKTSRPRPSLTMPPSKPFVHGCSPVIGYQALATQPNPPFGSHEWYAAHKLYVTAWGRGYVGPLAQRFWVSSVDQRASGLPPPRKKTTHNAAPGEEGIADSKEGGAAAAHQQLDEHAGDTPLTVGMQGSVLLFGFVMCSWSVDFGRETTYDDTGKVAKQTSGPMFALHPVGPNFRWYTITKMRKSFSHPRRCLEHLAQCLDDKMKLNGEPQKTARTMDVWGIFGVRDDLVSAFLKSNLAPTYAETAAAGIHTLATPTVRRSSEWAHEVASSTVPPPSPPPSFIPPRTDNVGKYHGDTSGEDD